MSAARVMRPLAWLAAAGLAAGAHAALGLAFVDVAPPLMAEPEPAGFLALELAALAAAPEPVEDIPEPPAPEAVAGDGAPPAPDAPVEPAPEPAVEPDLVAKAEPAPEPVAEPEPEPVAEAEPEPARPDVATAEPAPSALTPPVVLPPRRPTDLPPPPPRERVARAPSGSPGHDTFDSAPTPSRAAPRTAPRAAAPEPARPAAPSRAEQSRWQAQLLARLERHKRYPASARSRRIEGVVQLAFGLDARGGVTSARIARSSGSPELDQAALAMVRRASPLPAPPAGPTSITVPVRFDLR